MDYTQATTFKRSQLEDSLCRSNSVQGAAKAKLLVRIRRLLDIDRKLRAKRGIGRDFGYAFFSQKGPGAGHEASFQEYEIIALDLALLLAALGVPQTDVVEILRALRPELQLEVQTILERPLEDFMDIAKAGLDGEPIVSNRPVFLVVAQAEKRESVFVTKSGLTAHLLRGNPDWGRVLWDRKARVATMLEFSLSAHSIHRILKSIEPRRKGRP